jgi:hypothetical protein
MTLTKYNVSVMVFNPRRGDVECFLQSVYAENKKEAIRLARKVVDRGETSIVRQAQGAH